MSSLSLHRCVIAFFIAMIVAIVGLKMERFWLPWDQEVAGLLSKRVIQGTISLKDCSEQETPWSLKVKRASDDSGKSNEVSPLIIGFSDDQTEVFQSTPLSPLDVAVILKNLRRLGVNKLFTSMVWAWDEADSVSMAALQRVTEDFTVVVSAAPLGRGAAAQSMPKEFRRASLPLSRLKGDVSALPVVNRLTLNHAVLGGEMGLSGFSSLDNEHSSDALPLMARWDDRVVFHAALLGYLQSKGIELESLQIELGKSIEFDSQGHEIAIDPFGAWKGRMGEFLPAAVTVESVITRQESLHQDFAVLRDERTTQDLSQLAFSKLLPNAHLAFAAESMSHKYLPIKRFTFWQEIGFLMIINALLKWMVNQSSLNRLVLLSLAMLAWLLIQILVFIQLMVWLPMTPAWLIFATAYILTIIFKQETSLKHVKSHS